MVLYLANESDSDRCRRSDRDLLLFIAAAARGCIRPAVIYSQYNLPVDSYHDIDIQFSTLTGIACYFSMMNKNIC